MNKTQANRTKKELTTDLNNDDKDLELLTNDSKDAVADEKSVPLKPQGVSKAVRQVIKLEFQLAEAKRLAELGVKDEDLGPLTKPKRIPSEKQLENLKKGQQIREQNRKMRAEERLHKEEEEKKAMEELIIKKAITAKKRQIQKKKMLDAVIPDVEPINEGRSVDVPLQKPPAEPAAPVAKPKPKIVFV